MIESLEDSLGREKAISSKRLAIALLAGFAVGSVILGLGGRVIMSVLTITLETGPKFSLQGSLEVLGVGAVWGMITAPILLALRPLCPVSWLRLGIVFGGIVFLLAVSLLALVEHFDEMVAPWEFIMLSLALFPLLFVVHGVGVSWLFSRWRSDIR